MVSQTRTTRLCIPSPGSRGRSGMGAHSSLRSSWSMFVDAWATAQCGCCCSRHLQFGLLTTHCIGDVFAFLSGAMLQTPENTLHWDILRSGIGVWQLLSPKIFLHHSPASILGSWVVRGEREHPELHLSGKTKESPAAAGPGMVPQSHKHL